MIFFNKKYVAPKEGDFKEVKKFAFLPVHIKDKIVWFESYKILYIYERKFIPFNNISYFKWSKVDKQCRN